MDLVALDCKLLVCLQGSSRIFVRSKSNLISNMSQTADGVGTYPNGRIPRSRSRSSRRSQIPVDSGGMRAPSLHAALEMDTQAYSEVAGIGASQDSLPATQPLEAPASQGSDTSVHQLRTFQHAMFMAGVDHSRALNTWLLCTSRAFEVSSSANQCPENIRPPFRHFWKSSRFVHCTSRQHVGL